MSEGARVFLRQVLREPLAAVLLHVSLFVPQHLHMTLWPLAALVALITLTEQATTGCKNCVVLGKEERAMFRRHSESCAAQSGVEPRLVDSLLRGRLLDEPALRSHVYCVLRRCKLVGKDGKLLKAALLGKAPATTDARNHIKILERCAEQTGDNPEDVAWNIFRCGYNKKALLFEYMPTGGASSGDVEN